MPLPFVSYITFNRLGLTVKSLSSILNSTDDFDLHIIDNHSTDGTWEYIQSINDSRIKSKTQLPVNAGQIYALNFNLVKRQPDQYFITVDNDVVIETPDWISRFQRVFSSFPHVGLLGVMGPSPETLPPVIPVFKFTEPLYLELIKTNDNYVQDYAPKGILALRPELISILGYWSEENYFGNLEMLFRVNRFTSYKAGLLANIVISVPQEVSCAQCQYQARCQLNRPTETCFSIFQKYNMKDLFEARYRWKLDETIKDMLCGARPAYCASLLDVRSITNNTINMDWALENIKFLLKTLFNQLSEVKKMTH